jgi:hypothetical protein
MGPNTMVHQFVERLSKLNRCLLLLPEKCPTPLNQDEIIEILDQGKPPNWHEAMISVNIDIFERKRKSESLLSIEIHLTNSSDKLDEYFLFPLLSVDLV